MAVNDITIEAEKLGHISRNIRKASTEERKKASIVMRKTARALGIGAKNCITAVSRNPKATSSTIPDVIILS